MGGEIDIKVVIPTAGRYDTITTHKVVDNCILCVPEEQEKFYRVSCPDTEIVTHPPLVGLGAKRNWIYEKFGHVFMLDDDCKGMRRMYSENKEQDKVDSKTAYDLIQFTGNMCHMAGLYVFTFNRYAQPKNYHGHSPIKLKGLVYGQAMGWLAGSKIKMRNDIKCNNDIYLSLMNAYKHRMIWQDERFTFDFYGYGGNKGGLASVRTEEVEKNDFLLLKEMFGDAVATKKGT